MTTVENLEKELRSTQEMLAHVLYSVGEPVKVTYEQLQSGVPDGVQIAIDENIKENVFIFRLDIPDEQS